MYVCLPFSDGEKNEATVTSLDFDPGNKGPHKEVTRDLTLLTLGLLGALNRKQIGDSSQSEWV